MNYVKFYGNKECTEPFDLDFGEVEQGGRQTLIRYMRNEGDATPREFQIQIGDPELTVDYESKPRPAEVYPVVFEWTPTQNRGQTGLIPLFIDVECNVCGAKQRVEQLELSKIGENLGCSHDDYSMVEIAAATVEKYSGIHPQRLVKEVSR